MIDMTKLSELTKHVCDEIDMTEERLAAIEQAIEELKARISNLETAKDEKD